MGWTTVVLFPAGAGSFSLHHRVQTGSGAQPSSYPVGTICFTLGVKRPECEADHSPPSSAEVKNACSYTSTPPVRLSVATLSLYPLLPLRLRVCIQNFPGWVIRKYTLTFGITRQETTQRIMAANLTRLTHKIAIQLHLVAESCTTCSSRSRRPVRKLLDTPSYMPLSRGSETTTK
jgi:hypothetical protein